MGLSDITVQSLIVHSIENSPAPTRPV